MNRTGRSFPKLPSFLITSFNLQVWIWSLSGTAHLSCLFWQRNTRGSKEIFDHNTEMSFSTLPLGRSGGDFFWQGRRKNSVSCLEKERLIINSPALYFNNCGCLFSLCELSICSNVPFPWQLASKREESVEQNPRNYLNKWAFFLFVFVFFPSPYTLSF